MENQSYFLRQPAGSNCRNTAVPLQVNCTGYVKLARPFSTSGQRKDWYLQLMDVGALCTGERDVLRACQFILRSPDKAYRYGLRDTSDMGYYWVHFTGSFAESLLRENCLEPDRIYTLREETLQALHREFGLLFREFMLRRPGFDHMAAAMLTSILVRLSRGTLTEASGQEEPGLRKRLETSASYIHSHYTQQLTVPELAQMEHLSESRYRELFRLAFGTPPGDYIIGLRMARACELLQSTDLSVAQIGEICGYSDVLYFSRLFHKKQKVAPLAYRRGDG